MREVVFLKNNEKKWRRAEDIIRSRSRASSDEISEVFIEINDDLSYAQTNYPDSRITIYLNSLASDLYRIIYKNKISDNSIFRFWTHDLPLEFYKARKFFLAAFILFVLFAIVGAISTAYDEDFANNILGHGYVEMTKENIINGNPMGVYEDNNPNMMFLQICLNNLKVSFYTYILGVFLTLGSFWVLFKNALMVGTFQYMFFVFDDIYPSKGALFESITTIWVHGTVEISCIVLAAGAGMLLGSGFLFPGTYPRMIALQKTMQRSVKIYISIVPLIVVAAIIESYITGNTNWDIMPEGYHWIPKVLIIVCSLLFMVFYYILLPIRRAREAEYLEEGIVQDI